jgi:hypothetical protein
MRPAAMSSGWLPPPVLGSSPMGDTAMDVVVVDGATTVVLVDSELDVVGARVVEVVDVEVVDVDVVDVDVVVGFTVVEVVDVDVVVGFTVVEVVDVDVVVGFTVVEVVDVDVVVGFTVVEVVDVDVVVGYTVVEVVDVDVVVVGGGGFQQKEMWLIESFGDARSMPIVVGGSKV